MASKIKMNHIRKLDKIITQLTELENDLPESSDTRAQLAPTHRRLVEALDMLKKEFDAS